MNKAISKWPSKVLNLLVVLSMVIALCAVLATPVTAACPADETDLHVGCNLEVFVNTYIKDASGAFIPVKQINAGTRDEPNCFYVNAVVVNTGNETAGNETSPCTYYAKINTGSYATRAEGEDETKSAVEPIAQLGAVHMQEFWWKVCCTGEGNTTITVEAWSGDCVHSCNDNQHVYGSTVVKQIVPPGARCLTIEIIEAPGLNSPLPQMISESTDFGIKARITNNCDVTISHVNATISWDPGALANIIPTENPDPVLPYGGWDIGDLAPGEDEIVGWTLHCNGVGEVLVKVNATGSYDGDPIGSLDPYTTFINDPWKVIQIEVGKLVVIIDTPLDGAKIPTGCGLNTFPIIATVYNVGDTAVNNIYVTASANNAFVNIANPKQVPAGTLLGGANTTVAWSATCTGIGDTDIFVEAEGSVPGEILPAKGNDTHTVHQKSLITEFVGLYKMDGTPVVVPLDDEGCPIFDGQVDICQQYQIVFRINNYTGVNWLDAQLCINWTGPARLVDSVYQRKYALGVTPGEWGLKNASPGTSSPSCEGAITVCNCCAAEIKWTFECTGEGTVTFWAVGTRQSLSDESREVTVDQEYKAHLIGGMFTFLQDEKGFMQPRNAFSTCQDFHVVYPVVNTGDATAKDVVVNFLITGNDTYQFLSFSGDVVPGSGTFTNGIGHAHLGDIPGGGVKKMILLVHCKQAGDVRFWYNEGMGIAGTDENTNAAIVHSLTPGQRNNIVYPLCSILVKQIPFTVEILNPFDDENFKFSDNYVVKAVISNISTETLTLVNATISWGVDEPAELVPTVNVNGQPVPQSKTKLMGNIEAGRQEEITWEIHCTGTGDVTFMVTAVSKDDPETKGVIEPSLNACPDEVTVHQLPAPALEVLILSPVAIHTMIATGEPFAVSAMVANFGGLAAEDVQVAIGDYNGEMYVSRTNGTFSLTQGPDCITPGSETIWVDDVEQVRGVDYTIDSYPFGLGHFISGHIPDEEAVVSATWLDQFSLVPPSEMVQDIGTLGPLETRIVTWTLRAETTCDGGCAVDDEPIFVEAWGSNVAEVDGTMVFVDIYPAAHLVTVIGTITPVINVCDEFNVSYTVYNIGQADAWNTSVTLSVNPEGSVRIAGGETGYTQMLGTIAGYDSGVLADRGYATGTFKLHCKLACESTLTITPAGYDECGIHFVDPTVGMRIDDGGPDFLGYVEQPGRAIDPKFLEPASKTVKQLDSGQLDLAITKTADNLSPATGSMTVNFTITVTNNGPTAASGVKVYDALPAGLTFVSATPSQGSYSTSTKYWTVGSIVVDGSASLKIQATATTTTEKTNTATVTADQPDPFQDNNSASVTLNKTSAKFSLRAGWNLISLPLIPTNSSITDVLAGVWSSFERALTYDRATATWSSYVKGGPSPSLTTMEDGKAYWVKMIPGYAGGDVTFTGVVAPEAPGMPKSYNVAVGWNMIGFKSLVPMAAGDYLNNVKYVRIWSFVNGAYSPIISSGMMQPGLGYWVAITETGIIYP